MTEQKETATIKTYRRARRAYQSLKEMTQVRDGGWRANEQGQGQYVGHLVLPVRAQLRIRRMLSALEPHETALSETLAGIREDLTETRKDSNGETHQEITDLKAFRRRNNEALDALINGEEGIEVDRLRASDIGDDALEDVAHLLPDLGDLFLDDTEGGEAGDPRNREERRKKK